MSGKESNTDTKGVSGSNTVKENETPCGGGGMMAAPGQKGQCISRDAFESNPKEYFADLHARGKGSSKPDSSKPSK